MKYDLSSDKYTVTPLETCLLFEAVKLHAQLTSNVFEVQHSRFVLGASVNCMTMSGDSIGEKTYKKHHEHSFLNIVNSICSSLKLNDFFFICFSNFSKILIVQQITLK